MEDSIMFTPVQHPLVGTVQVYFPRGCSPYAPTPADSRTILQPGDPVTIESAWGRDYLESPPVLLYVVSHNTGQRAHVTEDDLITMGV